MSDHRPASVKTRRKVFDHFKYLTEHGWRMDCDICGVRMNPARDQWIADHAILREFKGSDEPPNVRPICKLCDREKTPKDIARIAKGKRQSDSVYGVKRPKGFRKPKGAKFDWGRGRYVREQE